MVEEIRDDKIHGASQLARQAVLVLKSAAEQSRAGSVEQFLLEQKEVGERLMSAVFRHRLWQIKDEQKVCHGIEGAKRLGSGSITTFQ